MTRRAITAFGITAALVLGACGDDGPSAMSEDDFADTMTELCEDAQAAADRADVPEAVDDFDGVVDYADEGLDVLGELLDGLRGIVPPEDLAKDFRQFVGVIEDKVEAVEAMKAAAEDEDEDGIVEANEDIGALLEDQAEAAEDLDLDACVGSGGAEPTTSDPTITTLPATETTLPATDTTLPATVTTLPTVTLPVVTLPSVPETAPPSPPAGGSIEISTIADLYAPPAGYTLVDRTADEIQGFVDVVASFPSLAEAVSQLGVADVLDGAGNQAATFVIAVTYANVDLMPQDWVLALCDPATSSPVTSPGGQVGTTCPGTEESGIIEAFTQATGPYGFSVVTFDPTISAITLADQFAAANG